MKPQNLPALSLPALVSTDWLAEHLGQPAIRVVDGSWYLPSSGRDPAAEYAHGHIPGAVFFDIEATSDRSSLLPHMLPTAEHFARRMEALGIGDADAVVVYDGSGVNLSAPRVWWMFRVFGHSAAAVLDGGMGKWRQEGWPVEQGSPSVRRDVTFTARLRAGLVRDSDAVRANIQRRREQVVDLRSAGRFAGTEAEPRPGLRGGHIPGSLSLPFTDLVSTQGTVLPPDRLRERVEAAGIDLAQPVVATCGSGVSACALVLALHRLGRPDTAVYDGAWTEWGGRSDTPISTGVA